MSADYSITRGKLRIRPMLSSDVPTYVVQKYLDRDSRRRATKNLKRLLKKDQENDTLFNFTIEYEGNIVGAIITKAFGKHLCDGIVSVDIPNVKYRFLCKRVKSIFVQFLRKIYIYDDIAFVEPSSFKAVNFKTLVRIPIACWKTRTTSV